MTADKVVDASVIAAVAFNEPNCGFVKNILTGAVCHAPEFIDVELASVCLKKIRQDPLSRDALLTMYHALGNVAINRVKIDLQATILLAERTKLSLYDASYLWLAQTLGIELVTLDARLAKAVQP